MASDFFLKFDHVHKFESFEGEAEQVAHDLRQLGDGFVDLGGGFLRIIDDGTATAGGVSFDLKLKSDDAIISHDFLKIGFDELKIAAAEHKFDATTEIVITKRIDQSSPGLFSAASVGDGGLPPLASDFLKYETDLKLTGFDFKAASDVQDAPTETLSLNFSKISVDYKQQSQDEITIGQDFIKLSGIARELKLGGLSDAFLKYGEDAMSLGNDYLKLSADFQKISQDFAPTTIADAADAGQIKFNDVVLQNPGDFIKLATDLKLLNPDLHSLASDTLKITEALGNPEHLTFKTSG